MWRHEREKELMEAERKKEEERIRQLLIRQEKERLMREHLPQLEGFLSPGSLAKSLGNSPAFTKKHHNTSNIFH